MPQEAFRTRDLMGREYWIHREAIEEVAVEQLDDYELESRYRAFNPEPTNPEAMNNLRMTLEATRKPAQRAENPVRHRTEEAI